VDAERRLEAERVFSRTYWRSSTGLLSLIGSFRRVAYIGLSHAPQTIGQENLDYWKSDRTRQLRERVAPGSSPEDMATAQAHRAVVDAQYAVDAASLVLAHSFLDAALYDYCRVTALACPELWEEPLLGRNITLKQAMERSFESLRQELLESHLRERIERSSLPAKAGTLYVVCKPPPGWKPYLQVYEYDRERLARLDDERHRIVHAPGDPIDLANIQDDLYFINAVLYHFLEMVKWRCGVTVNLAHVFQEPPG